MSDNEYIVWENTWRHRILKELEKKNLDWGSIRKAAKLSPPALNSVLGGLIRSDIIKKKMENGETVYKICGKYTVKKQDKTDIVSEEVKEERNIESLLKRVEIPKEFKSTIKPLAEGKLSSKYLNFIENVEDSIVVVSPYLDRNTHTRELLKIAGKKKMLLVTRTPDGVVSWNKENHKAMLDKFEEKKAFIIQDDKLHAKILLVDKKKCIVSSMNLTHNSLAGTSEYGLCVESPEVVNSILTFIEELEADKIIEGSKDNSLEDA
jgi:phosphatidylserine/phosphatidylglycerophosphate/cardiolipin synthase-like enzyme